MHPTLNQVNRSDAADTYRGLPEKIPKTEEKYREFGLSVVVRYDITYTPDDRAGWDGNYYALQKLDEALAQLPLEKVRGKTFQANISNGVSEEGRILFNPDSSDLLEHLTRVINHF